MSNQVQLAELKGIREYFNRSTACLDESDSGACPAQGMYTAAQQVAHVARTIDWFVDGIFGDNGFDMDFAKHEEEAREVTSLSAARNWFERSITNALARIEAASAEEMAECLPADSLLGPVPRAYALGALSDHTAHHRGALTVYARLQGKVPAMPYMDT